MIRWLPFALIISAAGCGGGQAEFTGQVTYRGKPIYRGSVTVVGSDKVPRNAAIGDDGTFRFDGVPTGVLKVGILSPEPVADDATRTADLGKKLAATGAATSSVDRKRWFAIPEKYGNPEASNLTVEVAAPSTNRTIELPE